MKVSVAASTRDVLGEGPVHDMADGSLRWVDIGRALWHRLDLATGEVTTQGVEPALTGFAPTDGGDYVGAYVAGFARLDAQGRRGDWLAQPEAGITTNRFNDAGTDPAGRFIAGTMNMVDGAPTGGLYSFAGGDLSVLRSGIGIANTITFSPEGDRLYTADSATGDLAAYAYALDKFAGDDAAAQDFVKKVLANVAVFDTGGRGATTSFVERGLGDVLITFEAEVENIRAMALSNIAQAVASAMPTLKAVAQAHREQAADLALAAARTIAGAALDRFPHAPLKAALELLAQEIDASPRLVVRASGLDDEARGLIERAGATLGGEVLFDPNQLAVLLGRSLGARHPIGAAGDLGDGDGLGADAAFHIVPFAGRLAAFAGRDPIVLQGENPDDGDAEQAEEDHRQAGKGQETLHLVVRWIGIEATA